MAKFSQYRAFVTIVETKSISLAALELNISPSAVSKQIGLLERRLNVQLFDRSNKRMEVTSDGEAFYQRCRDILKEVATSEEELQSKNRDISGTLSLTLSKSLVRTSVFDSIAQFGQLHPAIRFRLDLSDEVKDLQESEMDFALRLGALEDSSRLVAVPLREFKLVFVASSTYQRLEGSVNTIAELRKHRLITPSVRSFSTPIRQYLSQHQLNMSDLRGHLIDDIDGIYRMIMLDMGIGLLLEDAVRTEIDSGRLVEILPQESLPTKRLYLVYKKHPYVSSKSQTFKEFMYTEFGSN